MPAIPSLGRPLRGIELFAGCGGMAMGLSRAGVTHALLVERDSDAVATMTHNKDRGVEYVTHWPITRDDVRAIDWRPWRGRIDLISGGPPCQPFGIGGKKRGHQDDRDMWPEAVRAIREARPPAFLFENVRNLASPTFRPYLTWILACLRHPDILRRAGETHADHLTRIEADDRPPAYHVTWQVVNAADHGAPQIRHRVLIQGITAAAGGPPAAMTPTHTRDRLLWDQYVTGVYWKRHGLTMPLFPKDGPLASRVRALHRLARPPSRAWVTLRDAISGLGEPDGFANHVFQPGARTYAGHTGSPLDLPAKALKAGDHGVPGGENMIRFPDGSIRYLTMREAARLTGLPDTYRFPRSWSETMRQLGNAVPVQLAESAGLHLRHQIDGRQISAAE